MGIYRQKQIYKGIDRYIKDINIWVYIGLKSRICIGINRYLGIYKEIYGYTSVYTDINR